MRVFAVIALLLSCVLVSCAPIPNFTGLPRNSSSLRTYTWKNYEYIDLTTPGVTPLLMNAFDATSGGSTRIFTTSLISTLAGATATPTQVLIRSYLDGSGWESTTKFNQAYVPTWAALPADFGVANIASQDASSAAAFFMNPSAGDLGISESLFQSSTTERTYAALVGGYTAATTDHLSSWPHVATVFDALGRGGTFFAQAGILSAITWSRNGGYQATELASPIPISAAAIADPISVVTPQAGSLCAFYELTSGTAGQNALTARCGTLSSGTFSFDAPYALGTGMGGSYEQGHQAAVDGTNGTRSVFYQFNSGEWKAYSLSAQAGVWYGAATAKELTVPTGYSGYEAEPVADSGLGLGSDFYRPAIAHLGGGKYLVAWIAIRTAAVKKAMVLGKIFDGSSWSDTQILSGPTSYTTRPPFFALRAFANGTSGKLGGVTFTSRTTEAALEENDVLKANIVVYDPTQGFMSSQTFGRGCSAGASTIYAACTLPPKAFAFSSGKIVMIFQDQDSSGHYRLASVETE